MPQTSWHLKKLLSQAYQKSQADAAALRAAAELIFRITASVADCDT